MKNERKVVFLNATIPDYFPTKKHLFNMLVLTLDVKPKQYLILKQDFSSLNNFNT